jgi:hypothetical protein
VKGEMPVSRYRMNTPFLTSPIACILGAKDLANKSWISGRFERLLLIHLAAVLIVVFVTQTKVGANVSTAYTGNAIALDGSGAPIKGEAVIGSGYYGDVHQFIIQTRAKRGGCLSQEDDVRRFL